MATAAALSGGSTLHSVTDNQKRWLVFGIALNKVLVTQIRPFVEQEVQREYGNLQTSHSIHAQSTSGRLKNWPTFLKYENINGNNALPRLPGGRYNYSLFDCRVTSHVDFAKLYVENHMAKFNSFDEHCDASAVLALLGKVPVFSPAVQSAANDVRQGRNAWAHCVFSDWDPVNYQQSFNEMERLVKSLGLTPAIERRLLAELRDWETKGTILCMNATVDPDLLKLVQQHVNTLKTDVEKLTFEVQRDRERVSQALKDISTSLEELEARFANVQHEQEVMKQEQSSLSTKVDAMQTDLETLKLLNKSQQEDVQQRVAHVEKQLSSTCSQENPGDCSYEGPTNEGYQQFYSKVSVEISSCEGDVTFFAKRYDSDTRQWFFDDFDEWFRHPGNSRAYVLLGDPGVGKSVMAGALAQRMRKAGHLGAAYFCRHNNSTRNDPRYLLGTVARQLCDCNSQYKAVVGGEGGVKMLLGNFKLGIQELFTKLLQEPLSKCLPCDQRRLVIIDALDETEYESREDFLDLIMHCFPLLPEWLVFFITSRPEDSVQFRLKKYNPCVKICAGNSDQDNFYQQHEQDIQIFLKKRIDFSRLSVTAEDISKKCNGLFLYAHYIVEELRLSVDSGKELSDLFPGNIDSFFLQNFKRVYDQVGQEIFKKLFGCAIVAPAPLPVSIISYILNREKSNKDKQQVIDAVSQFVVLRTSDQTLTFLHNLIPAWLTDEKKARKFFIDEKVAGKYLKNIFVEILSSLVSEPRPSIDADLEGYVSQVAVRFLCQNGAKDSLKAVFGCLLSYNFIETRMQSGKSEIYHLLEDFKIAGGCFSVVEKKKQEILQEILFALESNVLVLLQCPDLLQSCIRNASNAVRETILIPQVTVPCLKWNEWNVYDFSGTKIVSDMHCFATSPDNETVAATNGRSLLFFDASTGQRVRGPFEVSRDILQNRVINHLEFSPDGKFLLFGPVGGWFSVEREWVQESIYKKFVYKWGSFSPDGQCIVVKSKANEMFDIGCNYRCVSNFLALWALKEIDQSQDHEMTCSFSPGLLSLLESRTMETRVGRQTSRLLERFGVKANSDYIDVPCNSCAIDCSTCLEIRLFNKTSSLAAIRQAIVRMYPKLFRYQVWDVYCWKPVLERVFSQRVQLNPFTYLCHMTCASGSWGLGMGCSGLDKAMSVCNIAVVNAVYWAFLGDVSLWEGHLMLSREFNEVFRSGFLKHVPIGFQQLDIYRENLVCVSPKRQWAVEAVGFLKIRLFRSGVVCNNGKPECNFYSLNKISSFTFTNDDLYFVYSSEGSLRALSLQTGEVLSSVSGCNLYYFTRERQVGYLFRGNTEDRTIFLSHLFSPWKFLPELSGKGKPIATIFNSGDSILSISSDSMAILWKTADEKERFPVVSGSPLTESCPHLVHGKNFVLSPDGKLIAFHQGTELKVHSFAECSAEEFLYTRVFEAAARGDFTVDCATFSADSTLLLFCIQDSRRFPHFYVWDVQQKVMAASLKSPGLLTIECCCFSSDKRLAILCGDYEIEILEYAEDTCRRLGVERPYHSVKFSQCTVSLDNQLLVCCIANRILIYNLFAPNVNSSKRVLRGHLGRIEFCRFLKANRYLISYGVDGMVFLWDISALKAVAFARITQGQEKIVTMAVSPEEDIAVCFTSSDRVCTIKLCGLGAAPSLKLLATPSKGQVETAETIPRIPRQLASSSAEDGMAESSSSSDSEEDMYYYYLEHDVLEEFD